jgi:hypothetical protein
MSLGLKLTISFKEDNPWEEIYDRAIRANKIVESNFGEKKFSYALLNSKDGYGRYKVSTLGEPYDYSGKEASDLVRMSERKGSVGFHFEGDIFVFEKNLFRPDFADYVGLHEFSESVFCYNRSIRSPEQVHREGCRGELEEVFKREKEFIEAYAFWLFEMEKTKLSYFDRAIPGFFEKSLERKLSPVETLEEFKILLDSFKHFE